MELLDNINFRSFGFFSLCDDFISLRDDRSGIRLTLSLLGDLVGCNLVGNRVSNDFFCYCLSDGFSATASSTLLGHCEGDSFFDDCSSMISAATSSAINSSATASATNSSTIALINAPFQVLRQRLLSGDGLVDDCLNDDLFSDGLGDRSRATASPTISSATAMATASSGDSILDDFFGQLFGEFFIGGRSNCRNLGFKLNSAAALRELGVGDTFKHGRSQRVGSIFDRSVCISSQLVVVWQVIGHFSPRSSVSCSWCRSEYSFVVYPKTNSTPLVNMKSSTPMYAPMIRTK